MSTSLAWLGRVLLATLFIVAGVRKLVGFSMTAAMMAGKGFPMPEILLALSIALDIGGALMLIANWNARPAAAAMALYTIVIAVIFHGFWQLINGPPAAFANELNHFLKNVAVAGGLLMVTARNEPQPETA